MAEEKTENQTEEKATSQEEAAAEAQTADGAQSADAAAAKSDEKKELTPEEKIAALEKENADLKDQLLRRAADFDNYRKAQYYLRQVVAINPNDSSFKKLN